MGSIPAVQYLNVEVISGSEAANLEQSFAFRSVSRSGAIVDVPEDYYVGVERAEIPLWTVPLAIGEPDPAGINGLDLVDKLTLSYNAFVATVPIRMLKQATEVNTSYPQPDGYWFIYDRVTLAAMLTDALARATAALNALAGPTIPTAPLDSFDAGTQLNTLTVFPLNLWDLTGTEAAGRAGKVLLWVNQVGSLMWQGFAMVSPVPAFLATPPQTADMWAYINIRNDGRNYVGAPNSTGSVLPPAPPATALVFSAGYPNTGISALEAIQIRSSLPSVPEFTDTAPGGPRYNPASNVSILTDLKPDSTIAPETFQSRSIYNGGGFGQIRWLKLTGRNSITTFDMSLWWVDRLGRARRLQCLNQPAQVKICFARRSIIDNYWAYTRFGEEMEAMARRGAGMAGLSLTSFGERH